MSGGARSGDPDRFERLFEDLESRADAQQRAEDDALGDELARDAARRVTLVDRLRAVDGEVAAVVRGVGAVRGRITEVGADVLVLGATDGSEWAVPVAAVLWVDGLGARAVDADAAGPVAARLGFAALVRRWSRDRLPVTVHLVEGGALTGTPDRAAADHLDLAEHELDEPRRPEAVRRVVAVPFGAIAALRRR
ncbi:MAG: hypothetical protein R2737_12770 [Candidatus Nanopelagicales bacterium]